MFRTQFLFGWLLTYVACSKVLQPIREEGEDVAYIIVAGADLTFDQYELLGQQIQQSSDERLWIQLSNNQYQDSGGLILGNAKQQLFDAGFPGSGFVVGGGHSYGAGIAVGESANFPDLVDALLLFGTGGSHDRDSFPLPVYIINGDMDGQVRVTITADSFSYTKSKVEEGEDIKLKYPHKVVEGVNHAQFCTGDMPPRVQELWIEPEVSDDESRRLLADAMAPYLTYYSSTNTTKREEARLELLSFYDECEVFFGPIFTAFEAEESSAQSGDTSKWTAHAQYIIADLEEEYNRRLKTNNTLMTKEELGVARPEIIPIENDMLLVTTVASLDRPIGINELYKAAAMIEVKYKSTQAIMEAFTGSGQPFNVTAQCRDANQAAWDWVWSELIPEKQVQRYHGRNITVEILDDVFAVTGPEWLDADLVFDFNGYNLEVQSTNLITSTGVPVEEYAGMHYCKLLSPAKALEFIYVDALYETFYHDVY